MPESPGRMPAATPMNVIIPAAGLGTRLAPASLAVPKELLPLGVHPALVACLLEADAAGLRTLSIVLSPGKDAIRRFLDPDSWPRVPALVDSEALRPLRTLLARLRICFAEQTEPAGVRDAVERGQRAAGAELGEAPCAVLYPDLVCLPDQRGLATLVAAQEQEQASAEATVFAVHDAGAPGLRHGAAARVELHAGVELAAQTTGVLLPIRSLAPASGPAAPGELRTTFAEIQGLALARALDREGRGADGKLVDAVYLQILNRMAEAGLLYGTLLPGEVLDLGTAAGYRDAARRFCAGEASLRELR